MTSVVRTLILWVNDLTLLYFILLNGTYLILTLLSFVEVRRYLKSLCFGGYDRIFSDPLTPGVSILVPVHNEERNIVETVKNLLHLRYPRYEVILINDGSTDKTLEELIWAFALLRVKNVHMGPLHTRPIQEIYYSVEYPSLLLIDKERGGKSDALNAGINRARHDYFLSVDGDALLEENSLLRIIRPVVEDPSRVVAVGGLVRVANGCIIEKGRVSFPALSQSFLPAVQVVEYLRSFLAGRAGLTTLNANLIISGAFGLFRKDIALQVGGYQRGMVGEDMEMVVDFHVYLREREQPYRVVYICDPVCWTEVPETLRSLSRQRSRWQRGLMESLSNHKEILFNPRYGWAGLLASPFHFFFEGWGVIVETAGYVIVALSWALKIASTRFAVAFLAVSVLLGTVLSLFALIMEQLTFQRYRRWGDILRLVFLALIENCGYKQLTSFFRLRGVWNYLWKKQGWEEMERRGVVRSSAAKQAQTGPFYLSSRKRTQAGRSQIPPKSVF